MKVFAIVLLCVVAAVQGRSAGVKVVNHQRSVAVLGENPWVVHLRLAVGTSGLLETGAGAIIDGSWILTTAEAVRDHRFIWVRYAAVNVIEPQLVLETNNVRIHEDWDSVTGLNNIALINVNRFVESTANYAPIGLPSASSDVVGPANYCAYGQAGNAPGEQLSCYDVSVVAINNNAVIVEGEDITASRFDTGAPLVEEGVLVGILTQADETSDERAVFIRTSAYVNWISGMTGVDFSRAAPAPAPEGPQDVIFVN